MLLGERSKPHSGVFNRDINNVLYGMSVKYKKRRRNYVAHAHAQSQFWSVKTDL